MLRRQLKRQRTTPQEPQPSLQAAEGQEEEEEDEWDACAELVDDTLAAIQLLTNRSAAGFATIDLPPLVLWHQLYVPTSAASQCHTLHEYALTYVFMWSWCQY